MTPAFEIKAGATFDEVVIFEDDDGDLLPLEGTQVVCTIELQRARTPQRFSFQMTVLEDVPGGVRMFASAEDTDALPAGIWKGDMAVRLNEVVEKGETFTVEITKGCADAVQN